MTGIERHPLLNQRWFECRNTESNAIPAHGVVEITGSENPSAGRLVYTVRRPIGDWTKPTAVVGHHGLASGSDKYGMLTFDFPALVAYDTAKGTPALGETWSSGTDTYKLVDDESWALFQCLEAGSGGLVRAISRPYTSPTLEALNTNGWGGQTLIWDATPANRWVTITLDGQSPSSGSVEGISYATGTGTVTIAKGGWYRIHMQLQAGDTGSSTTAGSVELEMINSGSTVIMETFEELQANGAQVWMGRHIYEYFDPGETLNLRARKDVSTLNVDIQQGSWLISPAAGPF